MFAGDQRKQTFEVGPGALLSTPPPSSSGGWVALATYQTLVSLRKFRIASANLSPSNKSLANRALGYFHPQASPISFRGLLLWGAQAMQSAISGGATLVCRCFTTSDCLSGGSIGRFVSRRVLMPWVLVGFAYPMLLTTEHCAARGATRGVSVAFAHCLFYQVGPIT